MAPTFAATIRGLQELIDAELRGTTTSVRSCWGCAGAGAPMNPARSRLIVRPRVGSTFGWMVEGAGGRLVAPVGVTGRTRHLGRRR